jgi:hypothetical protein
MKLLSTWRPYFRRLSLISLYFSRPPLPKP